VKITQRDLSDVARLSTTVTINSRIQKSTEATPAEMRGKTHFLGHGTSQTIEMCEAEKMRISIQNQVCSWCVVANPDKTAFFGDYGRIGGD
jgi:hypothetical protein